MSGSGEPGNGVPEDVRADIAHPARVYDYWLGGEDNFAADRAAAEQVVQVMPEILDTVRGNRQFLRRAVRFLREAGIRQFIDIGSGLPNSPNVHEIAQADHPDARVVTNDRSPEKMRANSEVAESNGAVLIPRGQDAILRMFNGRELVDPGLVLVSYWRPESGKPGPSADRAWAYGGVAAV